MKLIKRLPGSAVSYSLGLAAAAAVLVISTSANSTVHEIAAVACSGEIDRHPPGLDFGSPAFARPVIATGAVEIGPTGPVIADHPAAKYPAGTSIFALDPSLSTHPAFAHCKGVQDLP